MDGRALLDAARAADTAKELDRMKRRELEIQCQRELDIEYRRRRERRMRAFGLVLRQRPPR
jgi:hypothetical protein